MFLRSPSHFSHKFLIFAERSWDEFPLCSYSSTLNARIKLDRVAGGEPCVLVRFLFAVVLGSFPSVLFLNAQPVPMRAPASRPIALPLQFEENVGQYNLPMQFAVSGASGRLELEPGGTLVWLVGDTKVRVIPVGGNSKSRPVSDDLQITRRNYYYSIPVPREYTNVRSFGRVRYPEIYPGIDLVYYGSEGQLEYDFEVAPGGGCLGHCPEGGRRRGRTA